MLVLSRKTGQSLTLDGGIVITVCRVEAGKVRLGITAPKRIGVLRTELIEEEIAVGGSMDDRGHVEGVTPILPR